jgi:hypothetical protein
MRRRGGPLTIFREFRNIGTKDNSISSFAALLPPTDVSGLSGQAISFSCQSSRLQSKRWLMKKLAGFLLYC